jgi:16S rRNA (cytosine1402-N4)-methyltransferase
MLTALRPQDNQTYIDATFGAGGYSTAILNAAKCHLIAFDRDKNVQEFATKLSEKFNDNFDFNLARFSQIKSTLSEKNITKVDAIIADIGVSSMQLDTQDRGFSFNKDAPLDMRMGECQTSAYEVVNNMDEKQLADILWHFGEEKRSRKIAKKIIEIRAQEHIKTTTQLAQIVSDIYPKKYYKTHPATKSFQAIRIYVNQELEELKELLNDSLDLLNPGGRLIIVSFHSLEDKIVKDFMRTHSGYNDRNQSRYEPQTKTTKSYPLELPSQKATKPTKEELSENIRSRSARLRYIIKL